MNNILHFNAFYKLKGVNSFLKLCTKCAKTFLLFLEGIMTLVSGMVLGPKHHCHKPRAPQTYDTTRLFGDCCYSIGLPYPR